MRTNLSRLPLPLLVAATLSGSADLVEASEGGVSSWPMGIELHGMGILPPPGTYAQVFVGNYLADTLRDNAGNKFWRRSRLVAAITRTSTRIGAVPPTRSISPSCRILAPGKSGIDLNNDF